MPALRGRHLPEPVQPGRVPLLMSNRALRVQYDAARFQNGTLQQWKVDMPWARNGDVTAVNVGEIAARLGQFPADSLAPTAAEAPAGGARG